MDCVVSFYAKLLMNYVSIFQLNTSAHIDELTKTLYLYR